MKTKIQRRWEDRQLTQVRSKAWPSIHLQPCASPISSHHARQTTRRASPHNRNRLGSCQETDTLMQSKATRRPYILIVQ